MEESRWIDRFIELLERQTKTHSDMDSCLDVIQKDMKDLKIVTFSIKTNLRNIVITILVAFSLFMAMWGFTNYNVEGIIERKLKNIEVVEKPQVLEQTVQEILKEIEILKELQK